MFNPVLEYTIKTERKYNNLFLMEYTSHVMFHVIQNLETCLEISIHNIGGIFGCGVGILPKNENILPKRLQWEFERGSCSDFFMRIEK